MTALCAGCPGRDFAICAPIPGLVDDGFDRIRQGKRFVEARRVVWQEGQDTGEFLTLSSGWAYRYRLTSDGRRQIIAFLIPGNAIGLRALVFQGDEPSVKTLTDAEFCVFQREVVQDFVRRHPVGTARTLRAMAQIVGSLERRLVSLGKHSASERVARLILELHMRLDSRGLTDGDSMPFPLSQEHIGDAVGLTTLHVHRVLKALKEKKIIGLEDRRLEIRDRQALLSAGAYREDDLDQLQAIGRKLPSIDKP